MSQAGASALFKNEYLLSIILEFIDPNAFHVSIWDIEPGTRGSLLSAALTATAFRQPAISLLWRMLDSFMPLLKLLPSFVVVDNLYTIDGAITAEDQVRITSYSKYIKFLLLESDSFGEDIQGHAIHRLSHMDLFPNLQCLFIPSAAHSTHYWNRKDVINVVFMALSESLSILSINDIDRTIEDVVASYLSVLAEKEARLQDITLGGHISGNSLANLRRFSQLKFLNLTFSGANLDLATYRAWGSLPALTHLVVHLSAHSTFDTADVPAYNRADRMATFPALQELRIGGPPTHALKMLQFTNPAPALSTIILTISQQQWPPPESTTVIASTLGSAIEQCARAAGRTLAEFELRMSHQSARDIVLAEQALLALLGCTRLRRLSISGVSLAADDDTVRRMCANRTWAGLRVLQLPGGSADKALSLRSLKTLAESCPALVDLQVPVNLRLTTFAALQDARVGDARMRHGLQRLALVKLAYQRNVVDANTTEMAIAVSRFIEYYFPHLDKLELVSPGNSLDAEWWKGVKLAILQYKEIREEARLEDNMTEI